jgi:hemerythrin
MDTLVWRDDYSVGHALIDDQHRELFRRINIFGNALWEGEAKDLLQTHLRFLAEYVVSHFQTEERLMEESQFGNYAGHKREHDAFVGEVSDVLGRIAETGLDSSTAILVFERSCNWTKDHVRGMDQELGMFLSARVDQRNHLSGAGSPMAAA